LASVIWRLLNSDRDHRPIERERRDDDVDPAAVGQPRVHQRRRFVDPAPDQGHDARRHIHDVLIVGEGDSVGSSLPARST